MNWAEITIWLDGSARELRSGDRIKLLYQNEEILCQIVFSDGKSLLPGESAVAGCRLESPLGIKEGEGCLVKTSGSAKQIGRCTIERVHTPKPGLAEKQQIKVRQIEDRLLTNPFQPVLWSLIAKELFFFNPAEGKEIREYLEDTGIMVAIDEDLYFHRDALRAAKALIREYLEENGSITSGQTRDLLGSSRKFVIPLLKYFDAEGFTVRKGNGRVLS